MSSIIRVQDLAKEYKVGNLRSAYGTLRETLSRAAQNSLQRLQGSSNDQNVKSVWALDGVHLEIKPGEKFGIIGDNGAGKSTLLKILSRITLPTRGRVELYGRVASLLEVGTGFHPELTGRENIYLNGAILGMRHHEMERKFDEIVEFAEIEEFLDMPVKRYSSGMYTRLAFAVAAYLEPEILIVDEVLAVGDMRFQKKCLGKMQDVSSEGRTVIFVSHNMTAVQKLCNRAIWLDKGKIVEQGLVSEVVSSYSKAAASQAQQECVWNDLSEAPGNDEVRLRKTAVQPRSDGSNDVLTVGKPFILDFEFWNLKPNAFLNLSVTVYNEDEIVVFSSGPIREVGWHGKAFPVGLFRSYCEVPGALLNSGRYRADLYVVKDQSVPIFIYRNALTFELNDSPETRGPLHGKISGVIRPILDWHTDLLEDTVSSRSEDSLLAQT
jgi:lipopolysaccharide transport system ATP-binding protein